ncbi:hypothetical protein PHLGIDRAFT_30238 [Phlebiopsis gigantea 11061_1 CR5-6]|uniref:Elongator complex protein 5 n=1 Tax=Phlebiopsis gigantea (strain 11061_1 CR5-6) TaxID=745531 RepID=A0A0C3NPE5_PHLG1|nr:hypothetical protein PHLGIDRAFT_30238 [Phlebiopsis gigantea 11061_1 CR5-6]
MSDSSIPTLPPPGQILLVTDELASPADFILYRSLAAHFKGAAGKSTSARCLVVSVSGNLAKWKAVLTKSNVNLTQLIASRSLVFLDVASTHFTPEHDSAATSLRPIYDQIRGALLEGEDTLVILDDLSSLEWIGTPGIEVARFTRAVCALCRKSNVMLVLRQHVITHGELDDLLRLLLQLCTYRVDVFPLSSGRSGSVSGQIALHLGAGRRETDFRPIPRSRALLYRLTDVSSIFFERGTGAGVL